MDEAAKRALVVSSRSARSLSTATRMVIARPTGAGSTTAVSARITPAVSIRPPPLHRRGGEMHRLADDALRRDVVLLRDGEIEPVQGGGR
mgnify:CR=1 FL=1